MKRILLFLTVVLLMTSCATATDCAAADPYGFWSGLWHGIIAPFAFLVSLFNDSVAVYACNNTGGWYDFGFLLGIGAFTTGVNRK